MIENDTFAYRLALMKEFFDAGDYVQAFHLSYLLKQELLADLPVEPSHLGWTRYFGFRSLFRLQKFNEAWTFIETKEAHIYKMPAVEAAEVYHEVMEVAVRLSKPATELVKWGQKALDLKLAANDLPGAVDSLNTLCTFLGIIDQDKFNARYAEQLLELGIEYEADRLIIGGIAHLLRNPQIREEGDLRERVRERHAVIQNAFTGPFKDEARSIYLDYLNLCGD